ncbi:matrixin family metalloprotease [Bdellovibrio sp. 22V]|uniref:matrixin family metalloprotease n=1 Tax=Bdellovibrio TaxID=958 RepID=UPI002543F507|nr:matrixin family metalloprotease [Bdellovibrio sp. 22V]WII72095.1 matrixin family metalloprotease [Bdellovibrio sp. 22V]
MYKCFLFITLLALCACQNGITLGPGDADNLASAAETDCGFVQNAYGQRVSWKKNIPVTLELHKSFPTEYEEVLRKAASHWNDAAGMTLFNFVRSEKTLTDETKRDSVNTVHWLQEWPEAQKNMQGLTNLYWRANELYEADVAIDNKYFNFFIDEYQSYKDVHLESLLIHELGHVLGLKHRSTVPSVMWAVLNGALKRDVLTAADRETIKCEY